MHETVHDFYLRHEKELGYIEIVIYELQHMIEEQIVEVRKLIDGEDESQIRLRHPNVILAKYLEVGTDMRQYLIKIKEDGFINEP